MSWNNKSGNPRLQRSAYFEAIREQLSGIGYVAPICGLNKGGRYRLIVVAVNYLAYLLRRDPIRIYKALVHRAHRSRYGQPFCGYKSAGITEERRLEVDVGGELDVLCPFCRRNLLEPLEPGEGGEGAEKEK